jgi:hypothetical protein
MNHYSYDNQNRATLQTVHGVNRNEGEKSSTGEKTETALSAVWFGWSGGTEIGALHPRGEKHPAHRQ